MIQVFPNNEQKPITLDKKEMSHINCLETYPKIISHNNDYFALTSYLFVLNQDSEEWKSIIIPFSDSIKGSSLSSTPYGVVVFGGQNGHQFQSKMYIYSNKTFREFSHDISARSFHSSLWIPSVSRLLITGGMNQSIKSDFILLDLSSGQSKSIILKKELFLAFHTVSIIDDNRVCIFGGINKEKKAISTIHIVNLNTGDVETLNTMGFPYCRAGHNMFYFHGNLIVSGGFDNKGRQKEPALYNFSNNIWLSINFSPIAPSSGFILPSSNGFVFFNESMNTKITLPIGNNPDPIVNDNDPRVYDFLEAVIDGNLEHNPYQQHVHQHCIKVDQNAKVYSPLLESKYSSSPDLLTLHKKRLNILESLPKLYEQFSISSFKNKAYSMPQKAKQIETVPVKGLLSQMEEFQTQLISLETESNNYSTKIRDLAKKIKNNLTPHESPDFFDSSLLKSRCDMIHKENEFFDQSLYLSKKNVTSPVNSQFLMDIIEQADKMGQSISEINQKCAVLKAEFLESEVLLVDHHRKMTQTNIPKASLDQYWSFLNIRTISVEYAKSSFEFFSLLSELKSDKTMAFNLPTILSNILSAYRKMVSLHNEVLGQLSLSESKLQISEISKLTTVSDDNYDISTFPFMDDLSNPLPIH